MERTARTVKIACAVLATVIAGFLMMDMDLAGSLTLLVVVAGLWYMLFMKGE